MATQNLALTSRAASILWRDVLLHVPGLAAASPAEREREKLAANGFDLRDRGGPDWINRDFDRL